MGSLQFLMLFNRDFLGTPVKLFFFPEVPGRTFFPNLSKFIAFAAAPLELIPFVRNQAMSQRKVPSDAGQLRIITTFLFRVLMVWHPDCAQPRSVMYPNCPCEISCTVPMGNEV